MVLGKNEPFVCKNNSLLIKLLQNQTRSTTLLIFSLL